MTRSIWPIFYSILLSICSAQAAVHRVSHDDSSIQYLPSVCDLSCNRVCRGKWWLSCLSDGLASHRTKGEGTSANFSFKGSSITLYTRTAPDGGKAIVYIDAADPQAIDTNSPVTNEANPLYKKEGLDPTKTHTISVVYDDQSFVSTVDRFVDVRYFDYDDGVGSGSSNNQGSSSSSASPDATRSTTTSTPSGTLSGTMTASNSTRISSSQTLNGIGSVSVSFTADGTQSSDGVNPNTAAIGSSPGSKTVLSKASVAGIIIGSLALAAVILLCLFLFLRRRIRAQKTGFQSKFGTPHGFTSLVNKERSRDQGLNTAHTSRSPSVIRSPFEESYADPQSTLQESTLSLQLYDLSHQRGNRQDPGQPSSFRNPTKYGDQSVTRQNQEQSFTAFTDDVTDSIMSPTTASPLNPQNNHQSTGLWNRLLSQPVGPESGETFREKGRRNLSPPQSQVGGYEGDEAVSVTDTRSPTPPPMYTR